MNIINTDRCITNCSIILANSTLETMLLVRVIDIELQRDGDNGNSLYKITSDDATVFCNLNNY